ncbi:hypothetical protein B0H19DRAFT_1065968 [Mycena capillaripes]|nr:hypothetical protein B0H19DRAFT_1065968 [Mycena capillaripes]
MEAVGLSPWRHEDFPRKEGRGEVKERTVGAGGKEGRNAHRIRKHELQPSKEKHGEIAKGWYRFGAEDGIWEDIETAGKGIGRRCEISSNDGRGKIAKGISRPSRGRPAERKQGVCVVPLIQAPDPRIDGRGELAEVEEEEEEGGERVEGVAMLGSRRGSTGRRDVSQASNK